MELYLELLKSYISHLPSPSSEDDLRSYFSDILESKCYLALEKIKAVVKDDSLDDPACFMKIEEIICALEEAGIYCGSRHDFG